MFPLPNIPPPQHGTKVNAGGGDEVAAPRFAPAWRTHLPTNEVREEFKWAYYLINIMMVDYNKRIEALEEQVQALGEIVDGL